MSNILFWGISKENSFQNSCYIPFFLGELKEQIMRTSTLLSSKARSCYCAKKKKVLGQKLPWTKTVHNPSDKLQIFSWSQLLIVCLSLLPASMMFQYFVKVVPTVYMKVDGEVSTFFSLLLWLVIKIRSPRYCCVFSCFIVLRQEMKLCYCV